MQLHLRFTAGECVIPITYPSKLRGLLYNALEADSEYQSFLHQMGYEAYGRQFKYFVFGRLRGRHDNVPGGLRFTGDIFLEVRSTETRFIQLLLEAMWPGTRHRLGEIDLTVAEIRLENRQITSEVLAIYMDSPIYVHRTSKGSGEVTPEPFDPAFGELISVNAKDKWRGRYFDDPAGEVEIAPQFVRQESVKCIEDRNLVHHRAWSGNYYLRGKPAMLDLLYQTGLGSRNSEGFGLFNLCNTI